MGTATIEHPSVQEAESKKEQGTGIVLKKIEALLARREKEGNRAALHELLSSHEFGDALLELSPEDLQELTRDVDAHTEQEMEELYALLDFTKEMQSELLGQRQKSISEEQKAKIEQARNELLDALHAFEGAQGVGNTEKQAAEATRLTDAYTTLRHFAEKLPKRFERFVARRNAEKEIKETEISFEDARDEFFDALKSMRDAFSKKSGDPIDHWTNYLKKLLDTSDLRTFRERSPKLLPLLHKWGVSEEQRDAIDSSLQKLLPAIEREEKKRIAA